MEADLAEDQGALLGALVGAGVAFVVIGGHAVAAHGFARATRDVDIVFSTDRASCARLAEVLVELRASVRMADTPEPSGGITAEWLALGGQFILQTRHGTLDAFSWIAGNDHAALDSRAMTVELAGGTSVRVCGYEDLVAMKELARRPKDEEDLRHLRALDDER